MPYWDVFVVTSARCEPYVFNMPNKQTCPCMARTGVSTKFDRKRSLSSGVRADSRTAFM